MTDMNPHSHAPVLTAGAPLDTAAAAMILIHGRGARAEDILSLAAAFRRDEDISYFAPQAAGGTWYPYSFLNPIAQNEPWLTSALGVIERLLADLEARGMPRERVILGGFSQGACLATEFAARNAARYGGLVGLSGGLIGPPGTPRDYPGALAGTPVFLGCSDVDFHIPKERVLETAEVFRRMGGQVSERLYPGMGHLVNPDEVRHVQGMLADLAPI